jgi:hypothetical protein
VQRSAAEKAEMVAHSFTFLDIAHVVIAGVWLLFRATQIGPSIPHVYIHRARNR